LLPESFSVWKEWFRVFLAQERMEKQFSFANRMSIYRVAASFRLAAINLNFTDL
jgi:tagatose-1,6-bisphosphate aldolase non-catalytic subunit AgaZ/GatZ